MALHSLHPMITSLRNIGLATPAVERALEVLREPLPSVLANADVNSEVRELADDIEAGRLNVGAVRARISSIHAGQRSSVLGAVRDTLERRRHQRALDLIAPDAANLDKALRAHGKAAAKRMTDAEQAMRRAGAILPDPERGELVRGTPEQIFRNATAGNGAATAAFEKWVQAREQVRCVNHAHAEGRTLGLFAPLPSNKVKDPHSGAWVLTRV